MKLIESIDYLIKEPRQLIIHPTNDDDYEGNVDIDPAPREESAGGSLGSRRGLSINQASRVEPEARTSHLPSIDGLGGHPDPEPTGKCEAQLALRAQRGGKKC